MNPSLIKKVSVYPFNAELRQVFRISTGSHSSLENVLLRVELSGGHVGWGEAAPAQHITGETQKGSIASLKKAAALLEGRDVASYLSILNETGEFLKDNPCAANAVECAVLDAFCRHAGIPLWRLFGTECRVLASDMTVVLGSVEEAGRCAFDIYRRGIRAFKIKVGGNWDEDIERVCAVHFSGPGLPIYVDANQAYSGRQAVEFLKILSGRGVEVSALEQPVKKDDWSGLAYVTRRSGNCVVIADESVRGISDVVRIAGERAAHAVNIKTAKFGLLRGREMALLCHAYGLKIMFGGMMESALAMHASAHLAAATGGADFTDLDTPFFIKGRVTSGGGLSSDGIYDLSGIRRGLGVVPGPDFTRGIK